MTDEEYAEWFKSELIDQLIESDRFEQFLSINYDIKKVFDDDTKTIRLQIMEVPHSVAQDRIAEEAKKKVEDEQGGIQIAGADVLEKLKKI